MQPMHELDTSKVCLGSHTSRKVICLRSKWIRVGVQVFEKSGCCTSILVSLAEREHQPNSVSWVMILKLDIAPSNPKDFLKAEQHKHGRDEHELKHDASGTACPALWCLCFPLLRCGPEILVNEVGVILVQLLHGLLINSPGTGDDLTCTNLSMW